MINLLTISETNHIRWKYKGAQPWPPIFLAVGQWNLACFSCAPVVICREIPCPRASVGTITPAALSCLHQNPPQAPTGSKSASDVVFGLSRTFYSMQLNVKRCCVRDWGVVRKVLMQVLTSGLDRMIQVNHNLLQELECTRKIQKSENSSKYIHACS